MATTATMGTIKIRLAYFEDLMTLPIIYGIDGVVRSASLQRLTLDDVRHSVASGNYEVALLPTVEAIQIAGTAIVPCSCVAALGASRLFMVFSNKLPTEIQRVLVDKEDYGGMALAQLMFAKKLMIRPEFHRSEKPLDPALHPLDGSDGYDAYLLAGRHGFFVRKDAFSFSWDLTLAWYEYTRLPFVLHCWLVRKGVQLGRLEKEIGDVARRNETKSDAASKSAEKFNMTSTSVRAVYERAYYTGFDTTIVTSLRKFAQELAQNRIAPVQPVMIFRGQNATGVRGA